MKTLLMGAAAAMLIGSSAYALDEGATKAIEHLKAAQEAMKTSAANGKAAGHFRKAGAMITQSIKQIEAGYKAYEKKSAKKAGKAAKAAPAPAAQQAPAAAPAQQAAPAAAPAQQAAPAPAPAPGPSPAAPAK